MLQQKINPFLHLQNKKIKMGANSCKFSQKIHQKYEFIEFLPQSKFGPAKIYRKRQPLYDYLMVIERAIHDEDILKYETQLKFIKESHKLQDQPRLLRLYAYEIIRGQFVLNGLKKCNQMSKMMLYIDNLIDDHLAKDFNFSLDEVMYVLYNTIKIFGFYQNLTTSSLSAHLDYIFLTPEGSIKFSPIQISLTNPVQTECNGMDCGRLKFKKTFKLSDKIVAYQIKKLINQMVKCNNHRVRQDQQTFKLVNAINSCKNIYEMQMFIYKPLIEGLYFTPVRKSPSDQSTAEINKQSPFHSNSEYSKVSDNSKISVNKFVKNMRGQNKRPYSYQPSINYY